MVSSLMALSRSFHCRTMNYGRDLQFSLHVDNIKSHQTAQHNSAVLVK